MDNNYLFLKMQTGGQLSPEQLQRAQQMGQLPQMGMGAGLNDIQKMNMQQAEHYGMFRRGGVPRNYAEGGEQEEIDQQYLSPYMKYNQRVSEFLENLKSTAMGALQDEMMGVNDEYAQEADQIEMEQAQYGQQVSAPTLNPNGLNAVNSWLGAAQNTKDLIQPLAQTAGLASGLKGYWGGDQASYEANPYNAPWNPTRLTTTNKVTGEKTVTRAGRDGFNYGGQYFAPGGENENGDESPYDANGQLKPGYRIASRPGAYGSMRSVIVNSSGAEVGETDQSRQTQAGVNSTKAEGDSNTASLFMAPAGIYNGLAGTAGTALRFAGNQMFDKPGTNLQLPQGSSTGVGPFTGNIGAPAAAGAPTFGGVTPNFYSAGMQGAKSQWATGEAMNAYGDKARTDEAAYKAKQEEERVKAQQTLLEKNAIAMGWVNPDGTADVAGYSAPNAEGKTFGYGPKHPSKLPTSVNKKDNTKEKKDVGSSTAPQSGTAGTGTTGTASAAPVSTDVITNPDGSQSSISPEAAAKRKADAAAQATQVVDPGKTPAATPAAAPGTTPTATTTTTPPKTGTGEIDYLASLADPMGQNAGAVYRTDKSGNPVPMAFYDPNMRLNTVTPTYRNNVASWLRGNKKHGQLKSVSYDFSSGTPYTVPGEKASSEANVPGPTTPAAITQSPNVNDATGAKEVTGLTPNPDFNTGWPGMQQVPTYPGSTQNAPVKKGPITSMDDLVPNGVQVGPQAAPAMIPQQNMPNPGVQWNPQDYLPASIRAAQQAPLNAQQQAQLAKINQGTKGSTAGSSYSPAALSSNPAGTIVQGNDGNFYFQDANGQTHSSNNQNSLTQKRDGLGLTGKRNGGQYFGPGGENQEGVGVLSNPVAPPVNTNFFETGLLPQTEQSNYMSPALPGETVSETSNYNATYDKNKKSNPFFAPAMLAGLNTVAGAAQNRDAKKKEKEFRTKLDYTSIYSANPETSGNRGDWTFNEGYMRPNDMVPTQFTGNGMQTAQWGGAYAEGDELYLDEDAIQAFLAAGGQLDYLD